MKQNPPEAFEEPGFRTWNRVIVIVIAERIGRDAGPVSKHLAVLRRAGLVVAGRARLYQIPKQYLPAPGQRVADFGLCLLRLDAVP